ncbi:MAG: hypothetical protein GF405_01260 [Candidatus Eisenbacteria bacterium]|nr:hypothetical protein [Candidatus Eisenbacteria bacterium]
MKLPLLLVLLLLAGAAGAQETVGTPVDTTAAVVDTIPPAPVSDVTARDHISNNDGGDRIEVHWALSPDDGGEETGDVTGYLVMRSTEPDAPADTAGVAGAGETMYLDRDAVPGQTYYYHVAATDGVNLSEFVTSPSVRGVRSFFQPSRAAVLVLTLLFFGLVITFTNLAQRGTDLFVRRIPGLNAIEEAVGRATEMGRPVLYVPGIGEIDNIMTIASLSILSHVARITARYETPLIVPTARAVVMSAAEEVVKEAYAQEGQIDRYNPDNIRYLSDAQFAFAGAVNGIMLREKPSANLYLGAFWAESLLLAETGFEAGAIQVAGTAMVSQLPFFVTACDYTLLGEELYAASAYLSKEPKLLGSLKGSDYMKVISIALMLSGLILRIAGYEAFSNWFRTG